MKSHFKNFKQKTYFVLFLLLTLSFSGCDNNTEQPPTDDRGRLINSYFISNYESGLIKIILNKYNVDLNIEIQYDVDVFIIVYLTPGPGGVMMEASGALMIPKTTADFPAISLQHGTETKRSNVASDNPIQTGEGIAGLVAASSGFVVFIPDYLGLGVSDILHPYLHAGLSSNAIVDMLKAGLTFCKMNNIELNRDLYIGGYSEGGFTTLAAQKAIEEDDDFPFSLVASAPAAGPYDLYSTTTYFLDLDEYPEPAFMAYLFTAYNDVYKWNRLDNFFNAPYAEMMPHLFDGTKTTAEISSTLPSKISELFTSDFITGIKNGTEKEVIDALKENTLLNWTPVTPTRFYHSNTDEIVPYQNSVTAVETFKGNGAKDVELITLDNLQHAEGGVPAYSNMIEWFYSLKNN
jgi:hypothetical protein